MSAKFQNWWLARGTATRKLVKFALSLVVIVGALLFLSFNLHGEGSAEKGLKTRITVGQPTPWIQIEKIGPPGVTTNAVGQVTCASQSATSYVSIFTSSFAAGLLAIYSLDLLFRIRRIEKKEREEKFQ